MGKFSAPSLSLNYSNLNSPRRLKLFSLVIFLLVAVPCVSSWAQAPGRCAKCGMDLSKYPHTRFVIMTTGGQEIITCGAQCGLSMRLRLQDKWKSARATDILSNRLFDAEKGFYVYKSKAITDMAPGFISFNLRANAERFAKGFGGEVVTYEEAVEICKKKMD